MERFAPAAKTICPSGWQSRTVAFVMRATEEMYDRNCSDESVMPPLTAELA